MGAAQTGQSAPKIPIRELACCSPVLDEAALEQFQRQWATYQKLVDSDALSHNAVAAILNRTLALEFYVPFSFLDIACGDCRDMRRTLEGTSIARYRGIDLSKPALLLAARNLEGVTFDVELDHGDLAQALDKGRPADAAWCGLSIHHFQKDQKLEVLKAVRATTRKVFILYEPTCLDGETRDGYMQRFVRVNDETLTMLSHDEITQIRQHVMTCDYPETSATWRELGLKAGFSKATELFCDPLHFYRIYRFDC